MGRTAVVFPGQGSQLVGMGADVAASSERAAEVYARANDLLGFDLRAACFEGPAEKLESTDVQQPAIFVTSVAIWEAMQQRGASIGAFSAAAGLSLGEYTALHVAGAIPFEDALRLVYRRGQLMQEAAEAHASGMVSLIGAGEDDAARLCEKASQGEVLGPANFNCPGQIVISGARTACDRAVELAEEFGLRAIALKVAGAFHSSLMASAAEGLRPVLESTAIAGPALPVLSNVTADYHGDAGSIRTALERQITHPVLWQRSMQRLIDGGFECFVEVGTGRVLTGLMRKINRKMRTVNVGSAKDLGTELAAATG